MTCLMRMHYSSAEGGESRGKVAEWAAAGWQQPSGWSSCLNWVAEQWGAVEDEGPPAAGPARAAAVRQQSGAGHGGCAALAAVAVAVLLSCQGWRRQQCSQEEGERAARRWSGARALSQQLTWREPRHATAEAEGLSP